MVQRNLQIIMQKACQQKALQSASNDIREIGQIPNRKPLKNPFQVYLFLYTEPRHFRLGRKFFEQASPESPAIPKNTLPYKPFALPLRAEALPTQRGKLASEREKSAKRTPLPSRKTRCGRTRNSFGSQKSAACLPFRKGHASPPDVPPFPEASSFPTISSLSASCHAIR